MRLEQLLYLIEISRQSSLNTASERLHLTQQALSLSIKNLENEMGVPLLKRTHQGICLTQAGEDMLAFAQEMVGQYERLQRQFQGREDGEGKLRGELTIYANPIFYVSLLPDMVKRFCALQPEVNVHLLEKDPWSIYRMLGDGLENRLGFVTVPCTDEGVFQEFLPSERYHFQPISCGRYRVVLSRSSRYSKYKQLSVKTLLKEPIVLLNSNETNNTPLWHWLKHYGEPKIVFSTSSLNLWLNAITSGIGIGFLHDTTLLVRDMLAGISLSEVVDVALKEHLDVMTGCLIPNESSEIVRAFCQLLPVFKS